MLFPILSDVPAFTGIPGCLNFIVPYILLALQPPLLGFLLILIPELFPDFLNLLLQETQGIYQRIRHLGMIETVGYPFPVALDHSAGIAYHSAVIGHFTQYDRVGADIGIIADPERSQYFRTGTNYNIIADSRMAFSFSLPVPPSVTP